MVWWCCFSGYGVNNVLVPTVHACLRGLCPPLPHATTPMPHMTGARARQPQSASAAALLKSGQEGQKRLSTGVNIAANAHHQKRKWPARTQGQ